MDTTPATQSIPSTFNPATQSKLSEDLSFIEQYAMANKTTTQMDTQVPSTPAPMQASTQVHSSTTDTQSTQAQTPSNAFHVTVSFHKI